MTQLEALATAVNLGIRVLSARMLVILALILDAGLFAWAMWAGGWDRLAIACAFAVAGWFTVHFRAKEDT
jgi:hypothetical protein